MLGHFKNCPGVPKKVNRGWNANRREAPNAGAKFEVRRSEDDDEHEDEDERKEANQTKR
jgi:hypothetical protein